MKIIHMSDIHLPEYGIDIWGTNTMVNFDKAIELISKIEDVDAIIVTGDLSNDGSRWSYDYFNNKIKQLGIPTFCCPGNHDNQEIMEETGADSFHISNYYTNINGYDLLILNSTIPEMSRGMFSEDAMSWIERRLENSQNPTIIAFHHPCVEPGGWLNRKLLENRNDFVQLVSRYQNVKLVLYGHIHYSIQHLINECCYSAAPSIGFAFDKDLPKFQIAKGNEGFNLITIANDEIKINPILLK